MGHGIYTVMSPKLLPPLYLAYNTNAAGDSGKVHSDVRKRYLEGDTFIAESMQALGALADKLKEALVTGDHDAIPALLRENFRIRRSVYGDAVVGARNIAMIDLAAEHGFAGKFTGSGGAIVCCRDLTLPLVGPGGDEGEPPQKRLKGGEEATAGEAPGVRRAASPTTAPEGASTQPRLSAATPAVGGYLLTAEEERRVKAAFAANGFEFMRIKYADQSAPSAMGEVAGMVLQID